MYLIVRYEKLTFTHSSLPLRKLVPATQTKLAKSVGICETDLLGHNDKDATELCQGTAPEFCFEANPGLVQILDSPRMT